MNEHPNASVIQSLYAATGGPETVAHLFDADAVWHLPGHQPMSGDHIGRDAVLAAMRYFQDIQLEVHEIIASDDHAVALLYARGERNGKRYNAREVDIFHLRGGKITEFWSFSEDTRLTDEYWS